MSDIDEEELGERWKKFKKENWARTSYSNKFTDDDGNEIDWRTDPKARDDYFNQVETDYTYFCYDQKDPEACQKRAEFLSTFRSDFVEARAEYDRCCAKYQTPGCCLKSAHFMYYDELKKDMLKSMDMDVYWDKIATACASEDYARSKQQQDNRSEACLIIYNARKALTLQKGKVDDIVTKNISKNALELNLVERLERTCSIPNVLKNWDSCAALSAIFMNPKFSKIPSPPVALDVKRGIEYAVKACEGAGNGLGHQMSCVNLANLYERGNKMLGVDRNVELSNYFKLKAWYHTDEGMMAQHGGANIPAAGYMMQ